MKTKSPFIALLLFPIVGCLSFNIAVPRPASAHTKLAEATQTRQLQQGEGIKVLPGKSKRWALVIGVDDYSESQITRLSGAANDARTLAAALTRYAGFPEDQVTLLASDQPPQLQPHRSTILRYLSNLRGTVPKDGLLLVSFAGHGIERGGRAFLLPSDALGVNDLALLEDTAISVDRIKDSIRTTGVGQVILILDACRSDPTSGRGSGDNLMTADFRKNFNFDQRNKEIQAFATLYATDVGERAYEYDVKKQGYFTWSLVEGLRGAAANDQGQVTLQRLVDYLQVNVPKLVQRDLGSDKLQRPFAIIEGYRAADLVIGFTTPGVNSVTNAVTGPGISEAAKEQALWEAVKDSSNPQDLKDYLAKYPDGGYVSAARVKLRRLEAASNSSAPPTNAQPSNSGGNKAGAPFVLSTSLPTITANESSFLRAVGQYQYKRDLMFQEIGGQGEVLGEYHRTSQFTFDSQGTSFERIIAFPKPTLTALSITADDLEWTDLKQLFSFEGVKADRYNFSYVGQERIDELDLSVIDVEPKGKPQGKDRLYRGRIWVDGQDLTIVKARLKAVSASRDEVYPTVEIYREKIDGRYWFPTYLVADEELKFRNGSVHIKVRVKYTEFTQKP